MSRPDYEESIIGDGGPDYEEYLVDADEDGTQQQSSLGWGVWV